MSEEQRTVDLYGASYGQFASDLSAEIRGEAFGVDIGQNSWLTIDELKRFIVLLELNASSRVLDVGCGSGGPALQVCRSSGCEVVGVDVRQDAIDQANRMAVEEGLDARSGFQQVEASGPLPLEDASFDAILCIDAVNHLPDRASVFADWARLLRARGRLLFTDPITVTGILDNDEIAIRSSAGYYLFVPPGEDRRLLAEAGLTVLAVEDATENMAELARRRHEARAKRAEALRQAEGDLTFEGQQRFFDVTARLAREHRLSRLVYLAQRPH